jgi:uncharacterized protein YwqG
MGKKKKEQPYQKGIGNGLSPILITVMALEKPMPLLSSKVLGKPDVPDDFIWPRAGAWGFNLGKYDLKFICQINCAEAAQHDADHLLPRTGMLYFFDDSENSIQSNETLVFYYNGDLSQFKPYQAEDEESDLILCGREPILCGGEPHENTDDFNGYKIAFNDYETINLKKRKGEALSDHWLLGSPSHPDELADHSRVVAHKWQLLLQLDAALVDGYLGAFGEMCYFIDREDLLNEDFSKAWVTRCWD